MNETDEGDADTEDSRRCKPAAVTESKMSTTMTQFVTEKTLFGPERMIPLSENEGNDCKVILQFRKARLDPSGSVGGRLLLDDEDEIFVSKNPRKKQLAKTSVFPAGI